MFSLDRKVDIFFYELACILKRKIGTIHEVDLSGKKVEPECELRLL